MTRTKDRKPGGARALPAALVRRLGEDPDDVLAARHGVPVMEVVRERLRRGIAAWNRVAWDSSQVELLGTMSDAAVARELGCTPNAVWQRRTALGIPPFGRSNREKRHRWTKRQLAKLGMVPDVQLARELGLSVTAVRDKRLTLGVERPRGRGRKARPFTKAEIRKLGRAPDRVVAMEIGRGRHEVAAKRRALGIASFAPTAPDKGGSRDRKTSRRQRWTPELIARLGTVPDAELAAELGVTREAVRAQRARFGVPPAPG